MDFRIFVLFGLLYSGHCSNFRCHCNEPTCVRSFYLCKSELGCYKLHNSKSLGSKVKRSLKYGCIEHLPEEVSFHCWSDNVFDLLKNPNKIHIVSDKVNNIVTMTSGAGRERVKHNDRHKAAVASNQQRVTGRNSTLECCFQDLCNHDFEFDENLVIKDKDVLFVGGDRNVKYAAKNRRKANGGTRPTMAVDSDDEADKEDVFALVGERAFFDDYEKIGNVFGTVASLLYFGSRVPQVYKNFHRKSTDGVSVYMFALCLAANATCGLSVVLGALDWLSLLKYFPWLFGSLGVCFLDAAIIVQFYRYRKYTGVPVFETSASKTLLIKNKV